MHPSRLKWFGSLALRLVVAAVFVDAAVHKIWDPAAFAENTGNYQLYPELTNYIAITLPSIELVTALVLLFGRKHWRHAAALALLGMLLVFTTAIVRAWASGINLECGCFGSGSSHIGPIPVLRNVGLAAALGLNVWLDQWHAGSKSQIVSA